MGNHSRTVEGSLGQVVSFSESDKSQQVARTCALLADDKKADNIMILDVSKLTSFADAFVICSATSERHAQSIARNIMDSHKAGNFSIHGVEGLLEGHWILLDLGDVIFHVFTQEARNYYDLDGLWADAPVISFEKSVRSPLEASLLPAS